MPSSDYDDNAPAAPFKEPAQRGYRSDELDQKIKVVPSESSSERSEDSQVDLPSSPTANESLQEDSLSSLTTNNNSSPFRSTKELEEGTLIGGTYRVIKKIGAGGMGQVYLAEHLTLNKKCAVKIISGNKFTPKSWQRFHSEAQIIARLENPHLVRVSDLGIHENRMPYLVMDFVEGSSLAQCIAERGRLNETTTLEILNQLCSALDAAQKADIVHRDLKPANIMVSENPGPPPSIKAVVLDFGLAKSTREDAPAPGLTHSGQILGSPIYVSPEQCQGQPVDVRSDIYSLGCTLFECLTGQPPFAAEASIVLMSRKTKEEAPSLSKIAGKGTFTSSTEKLIARMLRKKPEERYQSIEELKADLQKAIARQQLSEQNYESESNGTGEESAPPTEKESNRAIPIKRVKPGTAIIGGALATILLAWTSVTYLPAFAPVREALPSSVPFLNSPETLLAKVRKMDEADAKLRDDPAKQEEYMDRADKMKDIVAKAKTEMLSFGLGAIEPCINELQKSQIFTGAHDLAKEVLEANGIAAMEPILEHCTKDRLEAISFSDILQSLGPAVGDRLCRPFTAASYNLEERDFAIKALLNLTEPGINKTLNNNHGIILSHGEQQQSIQLSETNQEALVKGLESEKSAVLKHDLLVILSSFRSPAPGSVPVITQFLGNGNPEDMRVQAALTMGSMLQGAPEQEAKPMVDALTDVLRDQAADVYLRSVCIEALARAGKNAGGAEQLQVAAKDSHEQIRLKALQALCCLAASNDNLIHYVSEALKESDQATRVSAIDAAASLGAKGKVLLPQLQAISDSGNSRERKAANRSIRIIKGRKPFNPLEDQFGR